MPAEALRIEPLVRIESQARTEPPAAAIPQVARDHLASLAKLVIEYALQPIVEVNTGHVYGYEALMRGFDRLHLSSPIALLDHAAEAGNLIELEQLLTARAIAKFASVPDIECKKLFLNLDGRTLGAGEDLIASMQGVLQRQGIPASAICIELSERHNNASVPGFPQLIKRLRSQGTRIAIDDFGIGFSELKLLCDFGIDYVKIDGHFIRGITDNPRKRLFVSTITNLAHVLGIRVIAEGVETEAEYLSCREAGCDLVQGYFVARPTCEISELLPAYASIMSARAKHRRNRKTDELLVRSEMVTLPTVDENTNIEAVFDLFRRSPQQSFFPVVDAGQRPRGIIHERDLKEFIYTKYGRELMRNKAYERPLSSFLVPCPVADINSDAGQILEIFANARGSDGVIVTENLRYLGVLSASALLKVINEKQIQQAQDQNPLTELPGNLSITDQVSLMALDGDQDRFYCYFDFDNFKPFNDRYGFQHGDRAISLFAVLMRRHLAGPGTFLGHVGGDDFCACISGRARADLEAELTHLLDEFRQEVVRLYGTEDQRAGSIAGVDRDGREKRFDLMRCSAAVVELPAGTVTTDLNKVDVAIAQAKSDAKRSAAGIAWRQLPA